MNINAFISKTLYKQMIPCGAKLHSTARHTDCCCLHDYGYACYRVCDDRANSSPLPRCNNPQASSHRCLRWRRLWWPGFDNCAVSPFSFFFFLSCSHDASFLNTAKQRLRDSFAKTGEAMYMKYTCKCKLTDMFNTHSLKKWTSLSMPELLTMASRRTD